MSRAVSTTYKYLQEHICHRKISDPYRWVDTEPANKITAAANRLGCERLKLIFEALNGEIPYEQIRIVVECLKNDATQNAAAENVEA